MSLKNSAACGCNSLNTVESFGGWGIVRSKSAASILKAFFERCVVSVFFHWCDPDHEGKRSSVGKFLREPDAGDELPAFLGEGSKITLHLYAVPEPF